VTKVYVVEVGEGASWFLDGVFVTRELAERYVVERARVGWDAYGDQRHHFVERGDMTFDDWREACEVTRDNRWGEVNEYHLLDALPTLRLDEYGDLVTSILDTHVTHESEGVSLHSPDPSLGS
jgi:hypothetical protein